MLSTDQKGNIAEAAIALAAAKLGVVVYRPLGEGGRCDMIFDPPNTHGLPQTNVLPRRDRRPRCVLPGARCLHWAEDYEFVAKLGQLGAVAQLGERRHGMAEVTGSIPVGSIPQSRDEGAFPTSPALQRGALPRAGSSR